MKRLKIISGGQTGVDRAALDAALVLGLPCGGFVPKGRLAEDGIIDSKYPMREIERPDYIERTLKNVQAADATLIIAQGGLTGGTQMTVDFARDEGQPHVVIDLRKGTPSQWVKQIRKFLAAANPKVLNVAGPRES
ncbi:MAG: hypothetical protein A2Z88_09730, partial [Omnitrophica WOR_2 bacterium GWA2_47_8]